MITALLWASAEHSKRKEKKAAQSLRPHMALWHDDALPPVLDQLAGFVKWSKIYSSMKP